MVSRSYSNLLELASGESPSFERMNRRIPRIMTVAGIMSDIDDDPSESVCSDPSSSSGQMYRIIIVANQLPIRAQRKSDGSKSWIFSWDENSLLKQLKDGLGDDEIEVIYVGCLKEEVHLSEQEEVSQTLLETFKCVPTFLPPDLFSRYYHGFCKQQLWPLFHYMLPLSPDLGGRFNRSLWQAYVSVNKIFADRIMEVINPEDDFVWVHDYHLMVLPTFLRKRCNKVKLGFFLHSPFPSSEIYKTLPIREELLRALLNSDLIGFHTFDYARHFLSCCSRMLGLSYESKRGYMGIEYCGRTVSIKILPVGIDMGQLQSVLSLPETEEKVKELIKQFCDQDRIMLLGVDDMDIFKGISLKLLAMEQLLEQHPEWQGKIVLVQIANPARGKGKDVKEVQCETHAFVKRINERFGKPGYDPIVLIDAPLKFYEKVAYYVVAECCLVTAVRDGMNLIPYEYIISRQGNDQLNKLLGQEPSTPKKSMLVISEFIGCSPSLSGAIRVNPWNIDAVADAMDYALEMADPEKQLRHEKHYRYVSTHDVGYWARSFFQDLERTCRNHSRRRCWGIGFGLSFRVVALDPNFKKLSMERIVSAYKRTTTRAILLDYDGTLMPQASIDKSPSSNSIGIINSLCRDKNNMVFLVSARSRKKVAEWFSQCVRLGLAAEHGYFLRLMRDAEWETCVPVADTTWKQIAEPVMQLYTETTDGSTVEDKETALVWCYEDADPDFGSCQAKELLDHLESVLANEPVTVKSGLNIVEVKPQGVSKGLVAKRLLSIMQENEISPDFVLCIGDDRSDDDMFEVITTSMTAPTITQNAEVFPCTVGQNSLDETVKLWKPDELTLERTNTGHCLGVVSVAAHPSGSIAASASLDSFVRVFDVDTNASIATLEAPPSEVWQMQFDPKGTTLAVAGGGSASVQLWDTEKWKLFATLSIPRQEGPKPTDKNSSKKFVLSVAWSPDGKRVACGSMDGTISVFDVARAKFLHHLEGHFMPVRSLVYSPADPRVLFSASDDAHVHMYDAEGKSMIAALSGHASWVLSVDASPDGAAIATGSSDKTVRLWDLGMRAAVQTMSNHVDQVWGVTFRPPGGPGPRAGRLASVSDDKSLSLYDYS